MTLNLTFWNMVNFQTKYTLIDEQDIPLVEGYSFEVRVTVPLLACFQSSAWGGSWGMGFIPWGQPGFHCPVEPHHHHCDVGPPPLSPGGWLFLKTGQIVSCLWSNVQLDKPWLPGRLSSATSPFLWPGLSAPPVPSILSSSWAPLPSAVLCLMSFCSPASPHLPAPPLRKSSRSLWTHYTFISALCAFTIQMTPEQLHRLT